MRRIGPPALLIGVGLVLLADFLVVNPSLALLAAFIGDLVIFVAAGMALLGVGTLAVRRGGDLWRRRPNTGGAVAVLLGMGAMLVAGLRPGSGGPDDPLTLWLVAALLVPLGASLFGLLFLSTLGALRRAVADGSPQALVLAASALLVLVLLLPIGGEAGAVLADGGAWTLDVPIGAVFRGLLIGVGLVAAVAAARTLLGIGATDE